MPDTAVTPLAPNLAEESRSSLALGAIVSRKTFDRENGAATASGVVAALAAWLFGFCAAFDVRLTTGLAVASAKLWKVTPSPGDVFENVTDAELYSTVGMR